jgi:hypothetical protein
VLPSSNPSSHSNGNGKPEVAESSFRYKIRIVANEKPLRLIGPLTGSPVDVYGDIVLDSEAAVALTGKIRLGEMPLEIFRRKATVKKMDFTFQPSTERVEVNGRIQVKNPDTTVFIVISGTIDAPIIKFESDPPLPPDEVISVLLFGSPIRDITLDDQDTVESAQALFVSRSVNLLSLYVLSSTPVRKIDFNPDTHALTAQIPLSEKTTMNIGGVIPGQGQSQSTEGVVGIHRRLGKSWSVGTEVESAGDKNNSSATAWLGWSKRY